MSVLQFYATVINGKTVTLLGGNSITHGKVPVAVQVLEARMVNQLLYSTFRGNSATRWGLEQKQHSVSVYTSWLRDRGSPNAIINIKCGLVVCTVHPWLAATPDGWVTDPEALPSRGLVEYYSNTLTL